jgi:hypothetical protein
MNEQLTDKERMLWKQAKKRVGFRRHLYTYLIINAFVWIMHFIRVDRWDTNIDVLKDHGPGEHFYFGGPVFMTIGWGIGLAFHYYSAYHSSSYNAVEKEYEKLKNSGK